MGIFCIRILVTVCVLCSGALGDRNRSDEVGTIESPRVSYWGPWSDWSYCPDGKFVTGFKLKVEPQHSGDNTGINAIRLNCGDPNSNQYSEIKNNIESPRGGFGRECACKFNSFVKGFTLLSEKGQPREDNSAANNLRIRCEDGEVVEGDNGLEVGNWTQEQICVEGSIVCGFRTQHEPDHVGDNTALNNVDMACCSQALEHNSTSSRSTFVCGPLLLLTTYIVLILAKASVI